VRYPIDDSALRSLGWKNKRHLEKELARIVSHYKNKVVW
jgi:dTDP-D-glucose 4,6-dehydratase